MKVKDFPLRKKAIGVIMSLLLVLSLMPSMAFAAGEQVSMSVLASGTDDAASGNTCSITSQADMNAFVSYVNAGRNTSGVTFTVTPLSDGTAYTVSSVIAPVAASSVTNASTNSPAIADSVAGFEGTFDGGGSTFNLSISTGLSATGMFGYVKSSGTVKNFTITGTVTVTGSKDAVGGVAGFNKGTLDNVINEATVTATSAYNVGGVAGFNEGYILNSDNTGAVKGYSKVGGINGENAGTINSCSNTATVKGLNYSKNGVGGIAGRNGNNNTAVETGKIYNCWNSGEIRCRADGATSGGGKWVGGICGFENSLSTCVNCYNIGTLTAYNTKDNIAGKIEGEVINGYGLANANEKAFLTGAEGYDGAVKKSETNMKADSFLTEISVGAPERWAQTSGQYPHLTKTAKTGDPKPSSATYSVSMASSPVRTVYQAGEKFDVSGMVVRVTYSNAALGTYDINTGFTVSNTSDLTTSDESVTVSCTFNNQTYSYEIPINVVTPASIYLNPQAGDDTKDGTTTDNAVKTLSRAMTLATANDAVGNTIYLMGTVDITSTPGTSSTQKNVVFKRASGFTGTMFNVNAGSNTVLMNNFAVNESGTIFTVSSGTLHLRGSAYVKSSNGTAIDVTSSGNLKIERALVSGSTNCISIAGSSNTFILSNLGGTTLSGKVYLGTGAYITVGAKIPCDIGVDMQTATSGTYVAKKATGYTITKADMAKLSCEGHDLKLYFGGIAIK